MGSIWHNLGGLEALVGSVLGGVEELGCKIRGGGGLVGTILKVD